MNRRTREIMNSLATLTAPVLHERPDLDRPVDKVPGLSVRMATTDTAELMIYGTIGADMWYGGITASDVASALAEITAGRINVRINSGGGDAFDGVAIYTQLMRHPAYVTTYIDGLAASAASVIAMAGEEIVSSEAGMLMIHDASTYTYGNGAAHREGAELLDKISDAIANVYANRAGEDAATWRAAMSDPSGNGTWYTGAEALSAGLIDRVERSDDEADAAVATRMSAALMSTPHLRAPERVRSFIEHHPAPTLTSESAHERTDTDAHERDDSRVLDEQENTNAAPAWAWVALAESLR